MSGHLSASCRFLDLSGYMFSGKAAVSDLLREFDGYSVPNYRAEFDLIRVSNGLLDLKIALDNWSWVRSDAAIRSFIKLTNVMAKSPRGVQKIFTPGFAYDSRYSDFSKHTNTFINDITDDSWRMKWPYELIHITTLEFIWLRIIGKIMNVQSWPEIDYHLCSGKDFISHAKKYLLNILTSGLGSSDGTLVTHNMLEPYNPSSAFCFFDDIKSIVVDRDVRDIYLTGTIYSKGFNDVVPLYSRIIGAFDIDIFIKRQKILRAKTNYQKHDHVLRVQFENLILNYEETLKEVILFLGDTPQNHVNKFKYFNPEKSKQNIGLWRNAPKKMFSNLDKIEKELPELCFQ